MLDEIVALTKKMIAIKSISQNSKELEKILELAITNLKGYTIERFENNGIRSILVYNQSKRPKKFKVILNGHLDVIPGRESQYVPKIKGNRLYGVGSMDMKANVACLISVFKEMIHQVSYPLGLQLVTDEEIGGFDGTKYQIDKGVRSDFVIAAEPTNFDIVNKAKGVLWLKISVKGKTAHGAYPWRGENAIWKMNEFLGALRKYFPSPRQEKWMTTVNLSQIQTRNDVFNKIPDDCSIGLDVRYVPEERLTVLSHIKRLLPKGFRLEIIADEPPLFTDEENEYVKMLRKTGREIIGKRIKLRYAQGSSDARHFAKVDCPGVEFGPIGGGIGSDKEWVDIPSLEKYRQILKNFLSSLQ